MHKIYVNVLFSLIIKSLLRYLVLRFLHLNEIGERGCLDYRFVWITYDLKSIFLLLKF